MFNHKTRGGAKINQESKSKVMGTGSHTFDFTPTKIKGYVIAFTNIQGIGSLQIQTKKDGAWSTKKTFSFNASSYTNQFFENGSFDGVRAILNITNQYAANNTSYITCAYI